MTRRQAADSMNNTARRKRQSQILLLGNACQDRTGYFPQLISAGDLSLTLLTINRTIHKVRIKGDARTGRPIGVSR